MCCRDRIAVASPGGFPTEVQSGASCAFAAYAQLKSNYGLSELLWKTTSIDNSSERTAVLQRCVLRDKVLRKLLVDGATGVAKVRSVLLFPTTGWIA